MNRVSPELDSSPSALDQSIEAATRALLALQQRDGHWVFELEADATIPAEYVLLRHYLDEPVDTVLEAKIAAYLRRIQGDHGGWPLFHEGAFDMSASVKAYFALKMIGDGVDATHMVRARAAIRARGGASRSNVFTRVMLALFGFIPWRAVPVMPLEIMLLPEWFPFHLDKVSYWSRTVIVPLLVLMALQPRARNPKGVTIEELFLEPPQAIGLAPKAPQQKATWFWLFRGVDAVLRFIVPMFPSRLRQRAIDRAVAWVTERLNGEDGLGAIFPAMANSVMMFDALGYPEHHPQRAIARKSIEKLLVVHGHEAYCQPCVSPIWDTALTCHGLLEAGGDQAVAQVRKSLEWLAPKQILDVKGDWSARRPQLRPGGWAFQYANPHYPDVDDTAVVVMAMDRARSVRPGSDFGGSMAVARDWILGMQSANGGWGAVGAGLDHAAPEFRRAVAWLASIQNADGGWGEDGTSYKLDYRGYERAPSTASQTAWALLALMAAGEVDHPALRRGIDYLSRTQGDDGLWNEPRYTATGFPRVFYLRYHGYAKFFPLWALARYRNRERANARSVPFGM